jgi:hypothetical protein
MVSRADLEKELRTRQEELRANTRSIFWGGLIFVGLALLFAPRFSLRSGIALGIVAFFLCANVWAVVTGRQRIATLKQQLDAPDM